VRQQARQAFVVGQVVEVFADQVADQFPELVARVYDDEKCSTPFVSNFLLFLLFRPERLIVHASASFLTILIG
jgi:hypothetical protein